MRRFGPWLSLLAVIQSIGCAAVQPEPPVAHRSAGVAGEAATPAVSASPPQKTGDIVQVTVLSADIRGRMANDEHWDAERGKGPMPPPLARYLALHPELDDTAHTLGVPVDHEDLPARAQRSLAADPMVIVEVGDLVFRSPVELRAFNPLWDFSFTFLHGSLGERAGVQPGAMVRIHVVDYDGPAHFDAVGSMVLPLDELLSRPIHDLGPFGSVNKLTLQVQIRDRPDDEDASVSVRLAVPGRPSWTDTGIDLIAGQRVWIVAADEVCTSPRSDAHCSGPEGQRAPHSLNLPGFETLGHGALVGAVGDTRFPVKRGLRFVAPASGRLRLGVNDRDSGNNSGAYAVNVVVYAVP